MFDPIDLDCSDDELRFVDRLFRLLEDEGFDSRLVRVDRLRCGSLNFRLTACQIGRIRLRSGATRMQVVHEGVPGAEWFTLDSIEGCFDLLPMWIDYAHAIYDPSREWPW